MKHGRKKKGNVGLRFRCDRRLDLACIILTAPVGLLRGPDQEGGVPVIWVIWDIVLIPPLTRKLPLNAANNAITSPYIRLVPRLTQLWHTRF